MADLLVIVPTYNERENVEPLAAAVLRALPAAHVLFVDDDSPDGTGELLDRLAAADSRVQVLHHGGKKGLGRAYVAGFQWALAREYAFVFEMDADFSHNPADLPRLRAAADSADLVMGSRYTEGTARVVNWPLARLILSKNAARYVRWITGLPATDPTGGFKCYRRAVLEALEVGTLLSNGYSFQIETVHRAWMRGFRLGEIPITFEERRVGVSKMSRAIVREAFVMVWKLWFRAGLRRRPRGVHPRSVASAPVRESAPASA